VGRPDQARIVAFQPSDLPVMTSVAEQVKAIIAEMAKTPDVEVDVTKWVTHYGVDSLGLLVLREAIERALGIHLADDVWVGFRSIGQLIDYAGTRANAVAGARAAVTPNGGMPGGAGWRLGASGMLYDDVDIGMPLTGLNNLAESPLLKHLGDRLWTHLSALTGVPSRLLVDADNQRLYPTFFYVEVAFPEQRPMAAYGENDHLAVASTLARFGGGMLDGVSYLLPPGRPETSVPPFDGVAAAVAAGVPAVRLCTVFVKQFSGAEWLKRSRPINPGFAQVPESALPPDTYATVKQAGADGRFALPGPAYVPMTDGPVRTEYRLVPDRDLNGAGLVYFANYPLFLDICEREVLAAAKLPLSEQHVDRRTLVRRQSAYLNNASARDTLVVEVEPWVENPVAAGSAVPEISPIRLFVNYRMSRKSDGRLMMVSTAEKLIYGCALEEVAWFADLCARGGSAR
jgi:probable biosynthetic protein (TIGR04098 family)